MCLKKKVKSLLYSVLSLFTLTLFREGYSGLLMDEGGGGRRKATHILQ